MAFLDISCAHKLTRQQRIEQPAEIDAEIVLDELRVKLRVVRDLDRTRRRKQTAQRRERVAAACVAVAESVEVYEVNAIRNR